ncbi:putative phosphoribosyltransferase [Thermodesulfitimonas autotrophica]|uniref:Putative phosphoribosyltransferase n=1 Tax=Thermodesulfitimonas autotrophica TaxID=1894989 RepID=A0A3N5AQM4_9THEO|nr:phosphoribosyltransferase [Thermodesulfitimonas autotrophica]RPF47183.1 putative phosphoribosyltransferase [Thermodesulfitimonas autotrophica]
MFADRIDAGRRLAAHLAGRTYENGLVVAIPRGGVVVGAEIARALQLPLDIIIPRKIGAPHNPELAIGAVTQDGTAIFNEELLRHFHLPEEIRERLVAAAVAETSRRLQLYRHGKPQPSWRDRTIILTDDGIATGYTVLAALRSLRRADPKEIILAVPVAPPDTIEFLEPEVDELVCLLVPEVFLAVGQFYYHFDQTSDEEVIALLEELGPKAQ